MMGNTRVWKGVEGAKFENRDVIFARITPCLEHGKMAKLIQPLKRIAAMFVENVKPIDYQIANLHKAINNLTQARDFLLPRLMNGKVKIQNEHVTVMSCQTPTP